MAAAAGFTRVTLLVQPIVDAKLNRFFVLRVILQKNQLLLRELIFSTSVSIEANPRRVCQRKSAPRFLIMWTSWRYLNEQCSDVFHILMGTVGSGVLTSNKFWFFLFFSFLLFFFLFFFCRFSFPACHNFFSYYLCICLDLIFCNLCTFLPNI